MYIKSKVNERNLVGAYCHSDVSAVIVAPSDYERDVWDVSVMLRGIKECYPYDRSDTKEGALRIRDALLGEIEMANTGSLIDEAGNKWKPFPGVTIT